MLHLLSTLRRAGGRGRALRLAGTAFAATGARREAAVAVRSHLHGAALI
jgi:hypothetical protein